MQQMVNLNPTETILKINQILDLPEIVGFRQHSDSDSNSDTSLEESEIFVRFMFCEKCICSHM